MKHWTSNSLKIDEWDIHVKTVTRKVKANIELKKPLKLHLFLVV